MAFSKVNVEEGYQCLYVIIPLNNQLKWSSEGDVFRFYSVHIYLLGNNEKPLHFILLMKETALSPPCAINSPLKSWYRICNIKLVTKLELLKGGLKQTFSLDITQIIYMFWCNFYSIAMLCGS